MPGKAKSCRWPKKEGRKLAAKHSPRRGQRHARGTAGRREPRGTPSSHNPKSALGRDRAKSKTSAATEKPFVELAGELMSLESSFRRAQGTRHPAAWARSRTGHGEDCAEGAAGTSRGAAGKSSGLVSPVISCWEQLLSSARKAAPAAVKAAGPTAHSPRNSGQSLGTSTRENILLPSVCCSSDNRWGCLNAAGWDQPFFPCSRLRRESSRRKTHAGHVTSRSASARGGFQSSAFSRAPSEGPR